jgi:hypothetical protein
MVTRKVHVPLSAQPLTSGQLESPILLDSVYLHGSSEKIGALYAR